MPVLQPAELWRKTGRLDIEELFKLTDRKGSELVLAMTHEEAVTFHIAQIVRSYRDLPLIVYHFQVKERDEPRPRAGVLRTREFIMKDSYSFDRDQAGLEQSYALHVGAYDRIMERTGLRFYRVEGDVGMMGGVGAHEYMAPCAAGEDEIVLGRGLRRQRRGRRLERRGREGRRGVLPRGRSADARTGDRGRQHLQARHPLLRAARRALPRRDRRRAARVDGLLRDRPGAHRGGRGRAVRRRARHLLAARARAVRRAPGRARQARHARARRRRRAVRDAQRGRGGGPLRRPRPRSRREVRRRRAARLPAAADRRAPLAGVRRDRGAAAPRRAAAPGAARSASEPAELLRAVDELWQSLP